VPKRYPPEFHRRVLELLKAGKSVTEFGPSTPRRSSVCSRIAVSTFVVLGRKVGLLLLEWRLSCTRAWHCHLSHKLP